MRWKIKHASPRQPSSRRLKFDHLCILQICPSGDPQFRPNGTNTPQHFTPDLASGKVAKKRYFAHTLIKFCCSAHVFLQCANSVCVLQRKCPVEGGSHAVLRSASAIRVASSTSDSVSARHDMRRVLSGFQVSPARPAQSPSKPPRPAPKVLARRSEAENSRPGTQSCPTSRPTTRAVIASATQDRQRGHP